MEAKSTSVNPECLPHLSAFVASFIVSTRRERWLDLLVYRRDKLFQDSSKLASSLNTKYCHLVRDLQHLSPLVSGVFDNFYDQPYVQNLSQALKLGQGRDAIFSIRPGKLVIVFFHEGEIYLCSK